MRDKREAFSPSNPAKETKTLLRVIAGSRSQGVWGRGGWSRELAKAPHLCTAWGPNQGWCLPIATKSTCFISALCASALRHSDMVPWPQGTSRLVCSVGSGGLCMFSFLLRRNRQSLDCVISPWAGGNRKGEIPSRWEKTSYGRWHLSWKQQANRDSGKVCSRRERNPRGKTMHDF